MRPSPSRRHFLGAAGSLALAAPVRAFLPQEAGVPAVVLDTDTYNEIDDQFAVTYTMLAPEAMKVEAFYAAPFLNSRSTSAADGMQKSYEEIHRVLERLDKKGAVPVYKGSTKFMKDAGGPVKSDAASDLIERALAPRDGKLYVLTVGAPTNVSSAIYLEPRIKDRICVIWLGGQPYDQPSAKEFNLQQDLFASRVLFDSSVELINIPTKNVSEQLTMTAAELERRVKGKSAVGDYLYEIFIEYGREHNRDLETWKKVIWDISAVAWLVNPGWVKTTMVSSPILKSDMTWEPGGDDRHGIRVATDVDREGIFDDLFERIANA